MAAVALIEVASVPPGNSAEVVANGRIFAVFNVDGILHVLDGICPHAGGPLGKGPLRGNIVTCPWHGWQFDVRDGQFQLHHSVVQPRLNVRTVGSDVQVEIVA